MRIVLSLVGVVVAAIALIALGVPSPIVIGLAVAGWVSFISVSRQSISQQVSVASETPGVPSSAELATEFSNIAFSDQLPTWKGWSKDVGIVTVAPSAITANGRKRQVRIEAPFTAELYEHKYLFWTMVKVTGSSHGDQPVTAYLVVRGAPISKGAVPQNVVTAESETLVEAINGASPV